MRCPWSISATSENSRCSRFQRALRGALRRSLPTLTPGVQCPSALSFCLAALPSSYLSRKPCLWKLTSHRYTFLLLLSFPLPPHFFLLFPWTLLASKGISLTPVMASCGTRGAPWRCLWCKEGRSGRSQDLERLAGSGRMSSNWFEMPNLCQDPNKG